MKTKGIYNIYLGVMIGTAVGLAPLASADLYSETYTSAPARDLRTAVVNFADLNLDNSAGQQILVKRIRQAAQRVCGSGYLRETVSLYQARKNKECQERAISEALDRVSEREVAFAAR